MKVDASVFTTNKALNVSSWASPSATAVGVPIAIMTSSSLEEGGIPATSFDDVEMFTKV